jgi:threonine aldolase
MIDLRSDTVTRPTAAMREAMMAAPLGDDVLGDEPTVQRLEAEVSRLLGHEAALYVPSGTMSNQLAIRTVCEPGDEVIAHRDSHIIHYETGAPAALSGCMIMPLDGPGGLFEPKQLAPAIRHRDIHAPRSRMLVLENTHNRGGGTVWPVDQFRDCCAEGRRLGLHVHLDGARVMNASVALGVPATEFTRHVDTLSICFSKGLGAPVGSALVGPKDLIHRARRFRKQFGGGMRQSGLLAAACLHALQHHVGRLAEDHANAKRLARGIAEVPGLTLQVPADRTPSNMVFFFVDPTRGTAQWLCDGLRSRGVLMIPMDPQRVRAVLHLDVRESQVDEAITAVRAQLS